VRRDQLDRRPGWPRDQRIAVARYRVLYSHLLVCYWVGDELKHVRVSMHDTLVPMRSSPNFISSWRNLRIDDYEIRTGPINEVKVNRPGISGDSDF
jgi:hypothetical protein